MWRIRIKNFVAKTGFLRRLTGFRFVCWSTSWAYPPTSQVKSRPEMVGLERFEVSNPVCRPLKCGPGSGSGCAAGNIEIGRWSVRLFGIWRCGRIGRSEVLGSHHADDRASHITTVAPVNPLLSRSLLTQPARQTGFAGRGLQVN